MPRTICRRPHAKNRLSDTRKADAPRASVLAVPRSSPIAAIPRIAPATTESMTATTPGTATNAYVRGGHSLLAIDDSMMPRSSSYLLVTK